MLKVNLLDYRYRKKKLFIQFETLSMVLLLLMLCSFFYLIQDKMTIDKEALQAEITGQTNQLKNLTSRTKKVAELEKVTKRVNQILADIEKLKKNLEDSSYFYDEVRKKVPFTVWLTKMSEQSGMLVISGFSESQASIADFMTNLKGHYKFGEINLVQSVRQKKKKKNYYQFIIQARYKTQAAEKK